MKHVMKMTLLVALVASPLTAQQPRPATRPATGAPAPMSHASSSMMTLGMDSTMAMHGLPMMMTGMAGMDSTMAPLRALLAYAPRALLERRAALRLDDDQASRLAGIAAITRSVRDSAMAAARHHRRALHDALTTVGAPAAAVMHFDALHAAMGAAHAAELRGALEARAVLTAGQRSHVDAVSGHSHH